MFDIQISRYKDIEYKEYLLCENSNVVILDVNCPPWAIKEIKKIFPKIIFLEGLEMSLSLEKLIKENIQKDTLLVFPGNGSNFVRKNLSNNFLKENRWINVFAKRNWFPGQDPVVRVGELIPEVYLDCSIRRIIVIDDVISSGLTMRKLYLENYWRFPNAVWIAATWIMQFPRMKASSGISGYVKTISIVIIEGSQKERVPVNSLSTLIDEPEIAENYAQRHLNGSKDFLGIIKKIKEGN